MIQRLTELWDLVVLLWDLAVLVFAPATVVLGLLVTLMLLEEWVQRIKQRGGRDAG